MAHIQVPAVPPRVQHTGDGSTAFFAFPFPILASADLVVYVGTTLMTGAYAVTGAGQTTGGGVTFTTPPASGAVVTLIRERPYARTTDFAEGGSFRVRNVNDEFDGLEMQLQQLDDRLGRAVTVADTVVGNPTMSIPEADAGKALVWNDAGTGLENSEHDPDEAWTLVTLASEDAAAAAASAQAAADSAASAAASAAASGAGSVRQFGPITLVSGTSTYALPVAVATAEALFISYGDVLQCSTPDDPKWTVDGASFTFLTAVTNDGAGGTWVAGKIVKGIAIGGVTDTALTNLSVLARHIAAGAISRLDQVVDGLLTAAKINPDADLSPFLPANSVTYDQIDQTLPSARVVWIDGSGDISSITPGTYGQVLTQGATVPAFQSPRRDMDTYTLSTAGGSVTWNIPSSMTGHVLEIDLDLADVSVSGSDNTMFRLGTGSGPTIATSGYDGQIYALGASAALTANSSVNGFLFSTTSIAGTLRYSSVVCKFRKASGNTWKYELSATYKTGANWLVMATGSITLPDVLTAIQFRTVGSNTFATGTAFASARV